MGLVKTVFSPLTNTTPLVTIILVIILVAVFRFSGGGVHVKDSNNVNSINNVRHAAENTDNDYSDFKNEGTIQIDANEFENLKKLRRFPKPVKNEETKKAVNSFDSIENELGLK